MEIFVVMFGHEDKDKGDEVKGYFPAETQAEDYCKFKNEISDGGTYYYEPTSLLEPV